jgi:hypothetical protein
MLSSSQTLSSPLPPNPFQGDALPLLYRPPASWKVDHRTRQFISLSERKYSFKTDLEMLVRSVDWLIARQDSRGSFHTDEEYRQGDRIDDQLGACSMLAFLLTSSGPNQKIAHALERGVRFHLDHLVLRNSSHPFPYSRNSLDYDSAYDHANGVWVLWGGALVLKYGISYLSKKTARELRDLMAQTWLLISTNPVRGENPCHNQLLAYCEIGLLYAKASGRDDIARKVMTYYHQRLRKLRIFDRGHWIYTEFNQWDANYGLLSWMALEHMHAVTGDPALAEDADEMALYFNEMVSAGGYYWGGPRYNEGGVEEFIHLPASRAVEMALGRLLLPAPADQWHQLVLDGHYGRVLVLRMSTPVRTPKTSRTLPPTPWSFRNGNASVCLKNNTRIHHVSYAGLEIIPSASSLGDGSGFTWRDQGVWKRDLLQLGPPPASEGLSYSRSEPIQGPGIVGLATCQRGYNLETRQWWISAGKSLLWIGQIFIHCDLRCEKMDFILGNPVLTRLLSRPVPVTEVETAEGKRVETQGEATSVVSESYLGFGDVKIGATAPLEFVRPSKEAFHTFPVSRQIYPRDCPCSNEIRIHLSKEPMRIACRQSLFFGVEIGLDPPALSGVEDVNFFKLKAGGGTFRATLVDGIWNYEFQNSAGSRALPQIGFGFDLKIV